jgi:hypothetical protein
MTQRTVCVVFQKDEMVDVKLEFDVKIEFSCPRELPWFVVVFVHET